MKDDLEGKKVAERWRMLGGERKKMNEWLGNYQFQELLQNIGEVNGALSYCSQNINVHCIPENV